MKQEKPTGSLVPWTRLALVGLLISAAGWSLYVLSGQHRQFTETTPTDRLQPAPAAAATLIRINPSQPPGPAPEGMAWIPGGTFRMGSDRHYPEDSAVSFC